MQHKTISILFAIATFILMVTSAVAVPIYFRPFYFWHIKALNLEQSGYSTTQIKEAYNEILDYLTLPGGTFHAGDFPFTASGASHFADCKVLFTLNAVLLLLSAIFIITLLVLKKRNRLQTLHIGSFHASFYAAISGLVLIVLVAVLASMDFYAAFVTFHSIFFPGKENWILNYRTDPIINVMPQDFFMHCAILIGAIIVMTSLVIIIWQVREYRKRK
ncbi:MAG: TIGR01906 family membrane protein [Peptococcaceae bacterium]|nr:TIGR01906 family membrane protein [Peptococcaceae bacterium]